MIKNVRSFLCMASLGIVALGSCSKVANKLAQSISWEGVNDTISVPPVSDTAYHTGMSSGSITYDFDNLIKSKTAGLLGMKNIDTFRVTKVELTILNPDASNSFGNFKKAQASFNTTTLATWTSIGSINDNPSGYAPTLSLPVNSNVNLRSYLPNSGTVTINYSYDGQMRTPTTTTLNVAAHIEYYIHVVE